MISGAPDRLIDRAGRGSTFREMRQLAIWILWSLKSDASLILRDRKEKGTCKEKEEWCDKKKQRKTEKCNIVR